MNKKTDVKKIVLGAILTALVVILQYMGSFIHLGYFSISLVLVPIVIGAATCGASIGAWLGFIFGVVVLISGDAAAFLAIDIPGTVLTVMLKGTLCGLCAGLVYKAIENKNKYVAVIASAIVCPLVNTGVFLLGSVVFFLDTLAQWGKAFGYPSTVNYIFFGLVGGNFLFELATNIILSPVILRLLNIKKRLG